MLTVLAQGQPSVVLHQEAAGADEFVGLLGNYADAEFLTDDVGVGQVERIDCVAIVDVENRGRRVVAAAAGQLLQRFVGIGFGDAGSVVVIGHA